MPAYDITVRCKYCGRDHPVLLRLHIEEVPERKQSITESFMGVLFLHRLRRFAGILRSVQKRAGNSG